MLYPFLIALGIIVLDNLTKWMAVDYLKPIGSFPFLENVLHFTYVENTGMAFGLLKDHRWIFLVMSSLMIVAISFYFIKYRPQSRLLSVSLSFVLGGGIGNMIDRLALGYVVDMIDVQFIDFAVFNVADSFVTVGGCLLMVYLVIDILKEGKSHAEETHV